MGPRKYTCLFSLFAATLSFAVAAPAADDPPAAVLEINGVKLTMADIEAKKPGSLFQARTNYYDAQRKAIEEAADDFLLAQAAKKEGITVDQLLERHVTSKLPKDPSDEALRVYYEGVDTAESYEAVKDKIIDALRQRRTAKAKNAYLQSLRSQATMVITLAPPRAPIATKDTPNRGTANAPIVLLEYADYECPYCQQIQPAIEKLETEFKGKIAFAYKDFPLQMHAMAQKAAEASRCAEAQGKYWEFHDILYSTKQLDPGSLKTHAKTLKLDTGRFDKCLDGGEKAEVVKGTFSEAMNLGLQGTPSFFVNGRPVSGSITYEKLKAIITEEMSANMHSMPASGTARGK